MEMEQYHHEAAAQDNSTSEDVDFLGKWKSVSSVVDGSENHQSGSFDCNICLDFVQDPVVTLCGHLYCWPCIYKWIHCQNDSPENPELQNRQCPVCKSEVSEKTLVPLYGRGITTKSSEGNAPNIGIVIPRRPSTPSCGSHTLITTTTTTSSHPPQRPHNRNFSELPQAYYPHPHSYTATLGGTTMTNAVHPMVGMFGEMVYSRMFGNSETTLYAYPNSYNLAGNTNPRVRRHAMQADKSLSRVSFFLCCCVVLCLLLF